MPVALDLWLLGPMGALAALGLVLVYSSSSVYASRLHHDAAYYLRLQSMWLAIGSLALAVAQRLPGRLWQQRSGWLYVAACAACAAVLMPGLGHWAGGARRWLQLGRLSCQPAELGKLAAIVLVAAMLAQRDRRRPSVGGMAVPPSLLVPVLFVQLPVLLILLEPDLGTALVIEIALLTLLCAAGLRLRALLVLVLMALPGLYHLVVGTPFRLRRVLSFIDPWAFRTTTGYQVTEALISMGSGGLAGRGLGHGKQKLFFLPEAHTDFIFAIIGEELGFAGVSLVVALFAILVGRALQLAARAACPFDQYLSLGLGALIGVPALFNLAVVVGLLPTKGLPLPFLSYGGSNLVTCMVAVGILLRVHADSVRAQATGRAPTLGRLPKSLKAAPPGGPRCAF